jgi:hypothetical protein
MPVKNVAEFSVRYMGYPFLRDAVHMWQRAKSNEQAFKKKFTLKNQWLNWPFNFPLYIAKFAFWKMKVGYAFLFINSIGSSFFLYIVEIVLVLNTTDVLLAGW